MTILLSLGWKHEAAAVALGLVIAGDQIVDLENRSNMTESELPVYPHKATFSSAMYDEVKSLDEAAQVIVGGDDPEFTTKYRWEHETAILLDMIDEHINLTEASWVLDYGCGVGRLAKGLIERHNCRVVGADTSPNMRALAASYVKSDRFFACPPAFVPYLSIRFDFALAVWVLQHCRDPDDAISLISIMLADRGRLFVANEKRRLVPCLEYAWANDGIDVRGLLMTHFAETAFGKLDERAGPAQFIERTFWGVYGRMPAR